VLFYSVSVGEMAPGRYWLDAAGNLGAEGAPTRVVARGAADRWLAGNEASSMDGVALNLP
jgi:hypothetical protein